MEPDPLHRMHWDTLRKHQSCVSVVMRWGESRLPRMPCAVGAQLNDKPANTAGFIAAGIDSLSHLERVVKSFGSVEKMGETKWNVVRSLL